MIGEWILPALIAGLFLGAFLRLRWGDDGRALIEKDHWKFINSGGSGVKTPSSYRRFLQKN